MVNIKRVYEEPSNSDGYRVLVDRLWPRGIRKENLVYDEWLRGVAPSQELRKWFGHKPENFVKFRKLYISELKNNESFKTLEAIAKSHRVVTLLYSAKHRTQNQARILQELLEQNSSES